MSPPIRTFCTLALALNACAPDEPTAVDEASTGPNRGRPVVQTGHSPPFVTMPYGRFSRGDAVAIAEQEWRLFGQRVYDDPPRTNSEPTSDDNPARLPGAWERIGEYWWLGQDANRREAAWTGMHDENGQEIDSGRDDYFAWSAAFISYVLRTAGAGARFPYAPSHYIYINVAMEMKLGRTSGWVAVAERVDEYAPVAGDLICYSRGKRATRYEKLPARRFTAHCDIVVSREKEQISVIGGNVNHAVTMKHVPVTTDGRLADREDRVLDAPIPGSWRCASFTIASAPSRMAGWATALKSRDSAPHIQRMTTPHPTQP